MSKRKQVKAACHGPLDHQDTPLLFNVIAASAKGFEPAAYAIVLHIPYPYLRPGLQCPVRGPVLPILPISIKDALQWFD